MNVVHQFEKINTWKNLVSIHPWNIDFLLSKNHMLLLLTADACETCEDAVTVFVGRWRGLECRRIWRNAACAESSSAI